MICKTLSLILNMSSSLKKRTCFVRCGVTVSFRIHSCRVLFTSTGVMHSFLMQVLNKSIQSFLILLFCSWIAKSRNVSIRLFWGVSCVMARAVLLPAVLHWWMGSWDVWIWCTWILFGQSKVCQFIRWDLRSGIFNYLASLQLILITWDLMPSKVFLNLWGYPVLSEYFLSVSALLFSSNQMKLTYQTCTRCCSGIGNFHHYDSASRAILSSKKKSLLQRVSSSPFEILSL